ncbi:MAG: endolytic transglycosylase MltG [Candidatus Sericytochromatia bacterium]|nr:endolytic transglycosylase MltG [Candidatus Sericytochromatia bacterium]
MRLILRLLATLIALALLAGGGAIAYAYTQLTAPGNNEESLYLVKPGMSLYGVSEDLHTQRLLRNPQVFRLLARIKGQQNQLKTGYYRFDGKMSGQTILQRLTRGQTEKIPYTIPEGYRIDQAAARLDEHKLSPETYIALARQPAADLLARYPFLQETSGKTSLEGYLFPDTYFLTGTEQELIEAQLRRFQELILPLWASRPASHPLNLDDTIRLASIVELEGVRDSELPLIAGVFLERLRIGMMLQSDPTTEYALGWKQGPKGLSLKDIQIDSPYNTYRYHGLPPTPIGNPGLAAVKAVIYPERSDYLYFVARGDGSHVFSRSYQEHLNAINRIVAGKK